MALAAAALALAAGAGQAHAATFTVGTAADTGGACAPASGTCSLRQLIAYENGIATPSPADVIDVPARTYNLSAGALTITQSLSIVGAGATIKQTTGVRAFAVAVPTSGPNTGKKPAVFISGLEITGNPTLAASGGVSNTANLTLELDWITASSAGSGGGVLNSGGSLTLDHSLVSANSATFGAGIDNVGGSTTPAQLTVAESTIAGNTATTNGGGIYTQGNASNTVFVTNATIDGNDGGTGGGSLGGPNAGGILDSGGGTLGVQDSILSGNAPSNCGGTLPSPLFGYNLEDGTDCGFTGTGDLQNRSPEFATAAPANNGGTTGTLALADSSPAIDAIPPGKPGCVGTDQRGIARPQAAGCDIGAFELVQPSIAATEGKSFSGAVATSSCGILSAATIAWGDGRSSAGTVAGAVISGTHTYAEEGTYNATVTYTSGCGAQVSHFQAKVVDAALGVQAVPSSATAGSPFSGTVAMFTDADPAGTASDYAATISWGDGSSSSGIVSATSGGKFVVAALHTYAGPGSYAVAVTVADSGGAAGAAATTATVAAAPAAPVIQGSGAPAINSTTSAAFSATVNPNGLPTTVSFQYGPDLGGAAAITYPLTAPAQTLPADFSAHTVTATVTDLLPNTTYHVRVMASNSAGSALGNDQVLKTPADPPPPPPVLGKSVDAAPVSGLVFFKLPAKKAHSALVKGTDFVPLTEARQLPVGTQVDARQGTLRLVSAAGVRHRTYAGDFSRGLFQILQGLRRKARGLTTLKLIENAFPGAPSYNQCTPLGKGATAAKAKHLSSRVLQLLHASVHGHFQSRGRFSAATVRGTVWDVSDRCDGTLTVVHRGTVLVTDFRRRITVPVTAGKSYLARAP